MGWKVGKQTNCVIFFVNYDTCTKTLKMYTPPSRTCVFLLALDNTLWWVHRFLFYKNLKQKSLQSIEWCLSSGCRALVFFMFVVKTVFTCLSLTIYVRLRHSHSSSLGELLGRYLLIQFNKNIVLAKEWWLMACSPIHMRMSSVIQRF